MDQARLNFDLPEGERLRDEGISLAKEAYSRKALVEKAREIAIELANLHWDVTADDVFEEMIKRDLHPELLGNGAGSIFRGDDFEFTGEWRKSKRVSNHARQNRVWRLKRA